jgi:uracil-DNA glycosylase
VSLSKNEWVLGEIGKLVKGCELCTLSVNRTNPVPGLGSPNATIMFVGEGPGANEDKQGKPFVGQAGKLLDHLLASIAVSRDDVFITNIVKCRPPNNRVPSAEEVRTCKPYLMSQIAIIRPKVIVTLGSPSAKTLISPSISISRIHGKLQIKEGLRYLPMYHPAAYLHKRSPDLLQAMKDDFKTIAKLNTQLV